MLRTISGLRAMITSFCTLVSRPIADEYQDHRKLLQSVAKLVRSCQEKPEFLQVYCRPSPWVEVGSLTLLHGHLSPWGLLGCGPA